MTNTNHKNMQNPVFFLMLFLTFFICFSLDPSKCYSASDINNGIHIEYLKEKTPQNIKSSFNPGDKKGEFWYQDNTTSVSELPSRVQTLGDIEITENWGDEFKKKDWRDVTSIQDLWEQYPEKLRNIFFSLDFSNPELHQVRTSLTSADTVAAGEALIRYSEFK